MTNALYHFFLVRYLEVYKIYSDLLNKAAEIEVANFIKEDHELETYVDMLVRYEVSYIFLVL